MYKYQIPFLFYKSFQSSNMENNQEYFTIPQLITVNGSCNQLISASQTAWRNFETYQQPPYQKISKYMRNIQYNSENVRTFDVLKKSLSYLIEHFIPLLLKKSIKQEQKYSLAIFLEERLKAIRCQLFVQGIICPSMIMSLIKFNILVQMAKQSTEVRNQLIGLQYIIDPCYQQKMKDSYPNEYQEALVVSVLSISKQELQNLLMKNSIIFEDERLSYLLTLRLKIQRNNYQCYYNSLLNEQPLVQCLLWRKIEHFKSNLIQIMKKSFGDVPLAWLYKRLGFEEPQNEGWVNVKQAKEPLKGNYKGFRLWIEADRLKALIVN